MLATTDFRSNFFQVQKWQYHSSERADVSKEEEGNEKEAEDLPGNSWPGGSDGKESTCNAGDTGSILGHNWATNTYTIIWLLTGYLVLLTGN